MSCHPKTHSSHNQLLAMAGQGGGEPLTSSELIDENGFGDVLQRVCPVDPAHTPTTHLKTRCQTRFRFNRRYWVVLEKPISGGVQVRLRLPQLTSKQLSPRLIEEGFIGTTQSNSADQAEPFVICMPQHLRKSWMEQKHPVFMKHSIIVGHCS